MTAAETKKEPSLKELLEEHLDAIKWQCHTQGRIDGAIETMDYLNIPAEKRPSLLANILGLQMSTAEKILKDQAEEPVDK